VYWLCGAEVIQCTGCVVLRSFSVLVVRCWGHSLYWLCGAEVIQCTGCVVLRSFSVLVVWC
jgi:hypothetical protein